MYTNIYLVTYRFAWCELPGYAASQCKSSLEEVVVVQLEIDPDDQRLCDQPEVTYINET